MEIYLQNIARRLKLEENYWSLGKSDEFMIYILESDISFSSVQILDPTS